MHTEGCRGAVPVRVIEGEPDGLTTRRRPRGIEFPRVERGKEEALQTEERGWEPRPSGEWPVASDQSDAISQEL